MSAATLGLVGSGRIGAYVARLLRPAFGRILVHDPFPRPCRRARRWPASQRILAQADVVSLHCPLTPQTRNLLNARRLALVKPGALLVNVSRGEAIDLPALCSALDLGRPSYAMLDVLPRRAA